MARPTPSRTLLRSMGGVSTVKRVYRSADAVEIDEIEGIDVARRRVLFDEILMVTRHRERGTAFVVTTAAIGLAFSALSGLYVSADRSAGLVFFGLTAAPAFAALGWRLAFGRDVVTIFGKRTKAVLRFSPLRGRADEVFRLVCRLARDRQRLPRRPPAPPT